MKDLIEQDIIFGSNAFLNTTGFITEVHNLKSGYEIVFSLDINDSIDPGHFVILTPEQFDTFVELNKVEWKAKNGAHCYLATY